MADLDRTLSKLMLELARDIGDDNDFIVEIAKRAVSSIQTIGNEDELIDAVNIAAKAVKEINAYRDIAFNKDPLVALESLVTPESLNELAAIASEFDKSDEPLLNKQAAVLDEILLTIGAQKSLVAAIKRSQDEEIAKIKASQNTNSDPYTVAKAEHDKQNHVAETIKTINDTVKQYRPLEAPLNTRTCPDHPGAQMARIAEHTYQCNLDKGIYNYETGYTTMKGSKVPGGDVANQSRAIYDRPNEFMSFDNRESRLNSG